jgi:transposase, IS30 family
MVYSQLTQEKRYQIGACLRIGMKRSEIAREVEVHRSTITRELRRNESGRWKYNPSRAIRMTRDRHERKRKHRIADTTWAVVEKLLRLGWSPEQISNRLELESGGERKVSHETIYRHIYRDKQQGGSLHTHLRRRHTYRKRMHKYHCRKGWDTRRPIHERPAVVATRSRIGDWEADTIIGRKHKGGIVSMVERRSRYCLLHKVATMSATTVADAVCTSLLPMRDKVLTITSDNGIEFVHHQRIANDLGADFFFADPYSSWQRGTNENTNGLVRQYLPKRTDFAAVTDQAIRDVADRLNNRPRKVLSFRTPDEVFNNRFVALIS